VPRTTTLLACLNAEIDATSAFIGLLEEEAELLTGETSSGASLATLPALTQAKQALADTLAALARTRAQHVNAANSADNHARTHAAAAEDDALWQAWHTLLNLADEAHSLNQRNGALIDLHLRHTQQSLAALRAAMGANTLYAADGRPQVMRVGVPIGAG